MGPRAEYALRKDLWAIEGNRIAMRFQYECHDVDGQWWRSYGNELWEFDDDGYMRRREASINDVRIDAAERRIHGPRPEAERGGPPQPLRSKHAPPPAGSGRSAPSASTTAVRTAVELITVPAARPVREPVRTVSRSPANWPSVGREHQLGAGAPGVVDEREARDAVEVLDALRGPHAGQAGERKAQRARAGRRARGTCAGR